MQNVACPMTIVSSDRLTPVNGEERVQRDAGDDPGQRERQHEQERDGLAAEEAEAVHAERGRRAEHAARRAVANSPAFTESHSAARTCGSLPRDREPLRARAGGSASSATFERLNA